MPALPTIVIARTGPVRHATGAPFAFSLADLAGMVAAYDGEAEPTPIVLGKPRMSDPAYGWIDTLKLDGGTVVATLKHVPPTFVQQVRGGKYPETRVTFYRPDEPKNPRPGSWYPRDVSFGPVNPADMPPLPAATAVSMRRPPARPTLSIVGAAPAASAVQPPAAAFEAPAGYRAAETDQALYAVALDIQAARPGLAFLTAYAAARNASEIAAQAERATDPIERDRLATAARAIILQAKSPALSFNDAMQRSAPSQIAAVAPPGHGVAPTDEATFAQANAIQSANPAMPWLAAYRAADRARALVQEADRLGDPSVRRTMLIAARMVILQAENPLLTSSEALQRATAAIAARP